MATYNEIPWMPEGVLDVAAATNQSFYVAGTILNAQVQDITTTSPPSLTGSGDKYLVASAASGAWSGMEDYMAVDMDTHWDFFAPLLVKLVLDLSTGCEHFYDGATWMPVESCAS